MHSRNWLARSWSVAAIMLATVALAAQDTPDFSGRWILASPRRADPDIPSALSVRLSPVRTDIRGERMDPFFKDITVDREFERGTRSGTHLIGVVGGVVPGLKADGSPNPQTHYGVTWEGESLVFESGSYTGRMRETGVWDERREVWSLDRDGRLRVAITTRSSADDSQTLTLVYRRP